MTTPSNSRFARTWALLARTSEDRKSTSRAQKSTSRAPKRPRRPGAHPYFGAVRLNVCPNGLFSLLTLQSGDEASGEGSGATGEEEPVRGFPLSPASFRGRGRGE